MKFQLLVFAIETHAQQKEAAIKAKLQERFDREKQANPRGYLDSFESRFELHCEEIVQGLGGTAEFEEENGELVVICNFTPYPSKNIVREKP